MEFADTVWKHYSYGGGTSNISEELEVLKD